MYYHPIKAWLFDEMYRFDRSHLSIDGTQGEWGAGDSIAAEEDLPPPPTHVAAKSGNGICGGPTAPVERGPRYSFQARSFAFQGDGG